MVLRQTAHVSFVIAFLLFGVGCGSRETVNTAAETAAGLEMATATALIASSTAVFPTPTVTIAPTMGATVTEVLATQVPEAAPTSQTEQVPAEAILYPDTTIARVENGIAYDQNGVVAARQVEHNGEMVWVPAIVEQMNARSHEAMNYALNDGSGRRLIAHTYLFEQFEWFGKPIVPNVVILDQARLDSAAKDIFAFITTEGLRAQNLIDPSKGPITIDKNLMVTHPETGTEIGALDLLKTSGTIHTHLIEESKIPPGVAGLPKQGGLSNGYGPTDNLHFYSLGYDPTNPSVIHIFMYVKEDVVFTEDGMDLSDGTRYHFAENQINGAIQTAFSTLSISHRQAADLTTNLTFARNNPLVASVDDRLSKGPDWPINPNDRSPAFYVELENNQ